MQLGGILAICHELKSREERSVGGARLFAMK